ncbi:integrase catalytic domain-containing protein [Trichonephila clavipes]|nr:integrase catalytic domain-containing protein [Trichonephila clavipes]
MIVLAWLRKEPMDLKTFVQNRVAKIQELYPNQLWRHVPSDQNPADLVSRGVDPDKLLQQNLWFNGPTFLSAVHIELVSDLTSQAFIAALKRFMARRGKCAKLFSDNGKNFVGASNEIKKLLEIVRKPDEKLANYLAAEGIEWKFILARSPNFGGLWEAAIKSCKYHLKRVVNGINLTHEELLTVTVQIEGILNSRSLCPLSNNDDDFQVLTPAQFLINRSLNSLEEPNLTKCKESNLKKWQKITKIVQLIRKFWSRNYLNQLQQRGKWMFEKNKVKIGDLVLIIEEILPTYKWALGRIVELYDGEDKKVRVVKIKTQYSTCKRDVSKICVLPMEDP